MKSLNMNRKAASMYWRVSTNLDGWSVNVLFPANVLQRCRIRYLRFEVESDLALNQSLDGVTVNSTCQITFQLPDNFIDGPF